jgi:hypothetical protein
VESGAKSGIDQACCQVGPTASSDPIIVGCFGEDRPGTDEDFDIVRNGTPPVPQPPWPNSTYPKVGTGGEVVSAFCIPFTNTNTINIPFGIGGPGAIVAELETCIDDE